MTTIKLATFTSLLLLTCLLFSHPALAASEKIVIPGTGDSQVILRLMAKEFEQNNPGTQIIIPDSVGSSGGIKMLINGKTDIARIARPLKGRELSYGLNVITFAQSPVVFAVNSRAKKLTSLSKGQLLDIYNGSISEWSTFGLTLGKIYPLIREQGDSSLSVISRVIPKFNEIDPTFSTTLYTTPDMIQTLLRYKRTIGIAPMTAVINTELQIIAIDNVFPNIHNVQTGKYKYVTPLSIVTRSEPTGLGKTFIDYLYSHEGTKSIIEKGAIPVKSKK